MPVENRRSTCAPAATPREITRPCPKCNGQGHGTVPNGRFYREARQRAGVTLTEIARALGVSAALLSRAERNLKGFDFLPKYAEAYDRLFERRRRAGATA